MENVPYVQIVDISADSIVYQQILNTLLSGTSDYLQIQFIRPADNIDTSAKVKSFIMCTL